MPDAPAVGSDGLTPAERLDFANRFRNGIGSRLANSESAAAQLTHVYRLVGPGRSMWHHHGTFTSIEAAKAAAEWQLAIYREAEAARPADEADDVEPLLPEIAWTMKRVVVGRSIEVGEPIPHLVYGEDGSAFRIEAVELNVTTYPDGREFRPTL